MTVPIVNAASRSQSIKLDLISCLFQFGDLVKSSPINWFI